jgi:hypothetical protein
MKLDKSIFLLKSIFVSLLFLFITCQAAAALEVAGVKVPEKISIGDSDTQLVLNGAGIRKKFFIKVYVGALYLPAKQNKINAILAETGPKRITMHFLYKELSAKKLVNGWNEGFSGNNSAAEVKSLQARINRFNKLFRTVVYINDQQMGTVEGFDFNQALLKIWLGKKPADDGLKKAWLGK